MMHGVPVQHPSHRRRIQVFIASVVAILGNIFPMSKKPQRQERAQWTDLETHALLDYLIEHQSEGGDGMNFKPATFEKALDYIAPHHTKGPPKTGKMLHTRYKTVSRKTCVEKRKLIPLIPRSGRHTPPSALGKTYPECTGMTPPVQASPQMPSARSGMISWRSMFVYPISISASY